MFRRRDHIEIKSLDQLQIMRAAGLVVAHTLQRVADQARPGVTTGQLDDCAAASIAEHGAKPSFLGYHGFPAHICTSVNDEVVHGIPGGRVLQEGDLISVDCGAIVDGWHGDAAISVPVGQISPQTTQLSAVTRAALWAGLAAAQVDARLSDIGHAVQNSIEAAGPFGIVEEYVGHGIGTQMHLEPAVPNYGRPGRGPRLVEGMALAIEPMVTAGSARVHTLDDDWTVVTSDGLMAAHWEHTVAITDRGPWVLTAVAETWATPSGGPE
ncbi:MAG: type I methionyl aminopeptidase [Candidatus Nanopelagicales bacterium]